MRIALVVLAGCWTSSALPAATTRNETRYDFEREYIKGHAFAASNDTHARWHIVLRGDEFALSIDGQRHVGTIARGSQAMDLREADHVLLECRRHAIEVHPRDARLSIACEGDSIGLWSNPAQMIDAWVCDEHTPLGGGRWDIVFVENRAVAELSATCCEYDVCDRGYDGYRFRD